MENDDQTAERMGQFLAAAGIDCRDVIPWNAYPWYINANPNTEQLQAGVDPLRRLIGLMPGLRVVLVHGVAADKGWKLFRREHLHVLETRGIVWLSTYHTSRQALQTPDPVERELREAHIRNTFADQQEPLDPETQRAHPGAGEHGSLASSSMSPPSSTLALDDVGDGGYY